MKRRTLTARIFAAALMGAGLGLASGGAMAAGDAAHPHGPEEGWSFEGYFGRYDRAALQRGYQVYKTVCAGCHSMNLLSYRNLGEAGGPEFPEAVVAAIAANEQIPGVVDESGNTLDDAGMPLTRPGRPDDRFKAPYANENAARAANNGALPPDLSVINKARHGGADYIYSLMTGYSEPPADMTMRAGMSYNKYFPGGQIAMPQLLFDGMLEYEDGTEATADQMAQDVTHFLEWAGEPKMEARKRMGLQVMIYLTILALLLYISYRRVWRDVDH